MAEFLKFYEDKYFERGLSLNIFHSSITSWNIIIKFKSTHPNGGKSIVCVEETDMNYAFAKAQVLFKDWLIENEGGY